MESVLKRSGIKDRAIELFKYGHNRREIADILKCEYDMIKKIISAHVDRSGEDPRTTTSKAVQPHEIAMAKDCIGKGLSARQAVLEGNFPERSHSSISYIYRLASGGHVRNKDDDVNRPEALGGSLDLEFALRRSEQAYLKSISSQVKVFPMPKVSILQSDDPEKVKADRLKKLEEIRPQHNRLNNPINQRSALFHKIMSGEDVNLDNL